MHLQFPPVRPSAGGSHGLLQQQLCYRHPGQPGENGAQSPQLPHAGHCAEPLYRLRKCRKDSKKSMVYISSTKKTGYSEIITKYKTISSNKETSLLEVELVTGKTHQIRAHLKHLGHSILGDNKYNTNKEKNKNDLLQLLKQHKYEGYCLTAYKLKFNITDNKLKYLNSLNIEISPTWKSIFEQTFDNLFSKKSKIYKERLFLEAFPLFLHSILMACVI